VNVLSPTSRAGGAALTSEPLPIRDFVDNPIQPWLSASCASPLSAPNPQSPGRTPFQGRSTSADVLRLISDWTRCTQERSDGSTRILFYCRSSCRFSSMAAPEIVPSNSPVFVKNGAPPEARNNTGINVAVNVSVPDAPLKRPVPPVI
jgi:hypothetical protein